MNLIDDSELKFSNPTYNDKSQKPDYLKSYLEMTDDEVGKDIQFLHMKNYSLRLLKQNRTRYTIDRVLNVLNMFSGKRVIKRTWTKEEYEISERVCNAIIDGNKKIVDELIPQMSQDLVECWQKEILPEYKKEILQNNGK